jgi:hypothetical protein
MIRRVLTSFLLVAGVLTGCSDDPSPKTDTDAVSNDTSSPDGSAGDDSSAPDPTADTAGPTDTNGSDSQVGPDGSDTTGPTDAVNDTDTTLAGCDEPIPASPDGVCTVSGSGDALLIRGNIILPEGLLERGSVLVKDGLVICSGCDCKDRPEAANATVFNCPDGVVSPGLINAHDHITYSQGKPAALTSVRYDHRNEWRSSGGVSVPGKPKISGPQNDSDLGDSLAELRHVMGGATSFFGSGAAPGLTRNLDVGSRLEGLAHKTATYDTFPLGSSGVHDQGCGNYDMGDLQASLLNAAAWVPHVAEGVNVGARNEQLCLDGTQEGSVDLVAENTGFIHAVGTSAADIAIFTGEGASLVWSPRTNTSLYGFTAYAPIFHRLGGQIALGSDWIYTGSMNMLRELRCAEQWNKLWDNYFTDAQLVQMATSWGAAALGFDDILGALTPGKVADLVIWDGRANRGFRAILDAEVKDVALVLRGGTPPNIGGTTYFRRGRPLYGDGNLIDALSDRQLDYSKYDPAIYHPTDAGKKRLAACENLDVCGSQKKLCLAEQLEEKPSGAQYFATWTYADMIASMDPAKTYAAFFCGEPQNEPTCVPSRPGEFTGVPSAGDEDGDGVPAAQDNCPDHFNAIRPMDNGKQPDTDGDGDGDVCDPCPFDADTTACTSVNPDDIDSDGVLNASDNCPSAPNGDQADGDNDDIGDACDACPTFDNTGGKPCPGTIPQVKKGEIAPGKTVFLGNVVATVIGPDFYTVQVPGAAQEFGGLYVFTGASGTKPTAGQFLDLQGTVNLRFGQTQLIDATFTVLPTPAAVPAPLVVNPTDVIPGGSKEAAVEALLVEVQNVVVTSTAPVAQVNGTSTENVAGEFIVTGDLRVDDAIYAITPAVAVGQQFGTLRGVLRYAWNRNKLLPRGANDVTYGSAGLRGFSTGALTLYAGTTREVMVELTSPATETTVVNLSSSSASATVPSSLSFAVGEDKKVVVVTAVSQGNASIKATFGGVEKTLAVTVVSADAQPKVIALDLDPNPVLIGETMLATLTLDLPARAGGTPVALSSTGAALTFPAEVVVPAGSTSVDFEVMAGATAGAATLTAAAGGSDFDVDVTVVEAAQVGLLLVEVLYDVTGEDTNLEWVKLYNGSGAAIDLTGWSLAYGGAFQSNGKWNGSMDLSGTIPAGACFVVGGPTSSAANFTPNFGLAMDFNPDIQNSGADADAVALFHAAASAVTKTTVPHDIVVYGVTNNDGFLGPNGAVSPVHVGDAAANQSIVRETSTTWAINPSPEGATCIVITQ